MRIDAQRQEVEVSICILAAGMTHRCPEVIAGELHGQANSAQRHKIIANADISCSFLTKNCCACLGGS